MVQQIDENHTTGPLLLGSTNALSNQVGFSTGPSLIPHFPLIPPSTGPAHNPLSSSSTSYAPALSPHHSNKPPLPKPTLRNSGPFSSTPKQPTTLQNKDKAHQFINPHAQSKTHLHIPPAQLKNKSQPLKPNPSLISKEIAASLFSGSKNDIFSGKTQMGAQSPVIAALHEDMVDFPPLFSAEACKKNGGNLPVTPASPNAAPSQTPGAAPPSSSAQPLSWAEMMEKVGPASEEMQSTPKAAHNGNAVAQHGQQPNIVFGRSMAEVLRSGQPVEGPVFLDREKSEKRGEVRIIEGKPCLFFSANETSFLAGRLGPAIVGKFSHSIPPARQIQKALGNLKLFGAMSWNFLNAKHIFIELSDMRDYVKILNGPNNSPVWYVDHHPMRVFKWTPDFDPFFETPFATAWCNILALPVHLFEESSLIAIGEMLGKPVQVDSATINRSRVSFARICVEVDLSRPIVDEIDINIAGKHVTLKVKWEKIPLYCHECKHVGHSAVSCYASGRRPMPPKRDYSRRPPQQNRPPPESQPPPFTYDEPGEPGESLAASFAAGKQPQATGNRPRTGQGSEPPSAEVRQQPHSGSRGKSVEVSEPTLRSSFFHGSSSTAAQGSHAADDDGFATTKKKTNKKNKKKAKAKARREKDQAKFREMNLDSLTLARPLSDGERHRGSDREESSSLSDRDSRSLSPSLRLGLGFGPLAMVLHDTNMFGALEAPSSDDDVDEFQDSTMVEASPRHRPYTEPEMRDRGSISPPPEGTPKRPRRSPSGTH